MMKVSLSLDLLPCLIETLSCVLVLICFMESQLKTWTPNFDFTAEVLRTVPLWVKLPNLPLHCWSSDSLSRLGSVLGVPICADELTTRQLMVSFARLLVEMVRRAYSITIEDPKGQTVTQKVVHEWTPPFVKIVRW